MNQTLKLSDVVLVVDDSPDTLGLLNEALEASGITVLLALDGKQAINIAQKIIPDVILLDAIMPNMDGFETCKKIKEQGNLADIPVIFMTGLSDTESIVKGLEAGGVDYLTKPINPDELVARMRVHLNNARRTNSAQQALDRNGQHLFSISVKGELRWATKQAKQLLNDAYQQSSLTASLTPEQHNELIFSKVSNWLQHNPLREQYLRLNELDHPLSVQLMSSIQDDELVFKLSDPEKQPSAATLRKGLPITERESDVLYWIAQGKTNKEIGEILELSPRTINKHLETIFRKLSVENRTTAAAIAIRTLNQQ